MGNIVLLDDLTINQIAAGEVVERPASVVKELVENSIDAGATNISVEIKNGGISYIRITDNGKGIMPDDMEIAFERHATSKIRKAEDLEIVKSMGFRGEALASISAIARVEMQSKTEESPIGYKIIVEGGKIISKEECGCPKGTTITVQNLFYNTPVRYKFLKKDFTEFGYIEDAITRIALINSNISIKLINSGKTVIQTSGNNDMKAVLYNIYGRDVAQNCLEVDYTYEDIKITGVVGKPIIARSNRSNQLFFVNKRYVKDKTLSSAAEQSYKGLLTVGKYGFLVLNLDIDMRKVDVNVHPAKLEVRFEEESKVFKAVYHAIKETLLKENIGINGEKIDDIRNNTFANFNNIQKQNYVKPEQKNIQNTNANLNFENNIEKKELNPEIELKKKLDSLKKLVDIKNIAGSENNENAENIENKNETESETNLKESQTKENESELKNTNENEKKFDIMEEIKKMQSGIYNYENDPEYTTIKQIRSLTQENTDSNEKTENTKQNDQVIADMQKTENEKQKNISEVERNKELNNIVEKVHELEETKMEIDANNFEEMYAKMFGILPKEEQKENIEENVLKEEAIEYHLEDNNLENISLFTNNKINNIPNYKFIGIAFETYIIIEMDKEMYIIDQHAVHERILYEKIKKNYYSEGTKESQLMLLPDIITLNYKEMGVAKDNMELFEKAGFTLEEFGENTIKVSGVPNVCIDLETKELFLETLDEINTVARTAKQEIEEKLISTLASKAAVKSNIALSKEEVNELMKELLILDNPFIGLNGKPTAMRMSRAEIEKKFSRR